MLYDLSNDFDRQRFDEQCKSLKDKRHRVELKRKAARSLSQNSYLHVLLGYYGSEFGYTIEQVKMEVFKQTCNRELFERQRVNKRGQTVTYIRSTSDLDTNEMTTAIERFRNWSASVAGLYLPAPHEDEMLFYAEQQLEANRDYL